MDGMDGNMTCVRCGSREFARRAEGYRCWRCGAKVVVKEEKDEVGERVRAWAAQPEPPAEPPPAPPEAPAAPPNAEAARPGSKPAASATSTDAPADEPANGRPEEFGAIAPIGGEMPGEAALVVRSTVPKVDAEKIAGEAIRGGFFRPADIEGATLAPIALVWVPVWRVDAAVEGFHVGLSHGTGPDGRLRWALPTGGYRHRDGVVLVAGRRLLAVDPTAKLELGIEDMQAHARVPTDGEVVGADVSREEAEAEAIERLRRRVQPSSALYAKFDARVRSSALCWYPLWVARYRYRGEAARTAGPEECHVAVSARTGRIVSARHPSKLRAAFGKVKGFFAGAFGDA